MPHMTRDPRKLPWRSNQILAGNVTVLDHSCHILDSFRRNNNVEEDRECALLASHKILLGGPFFHQKMSL